MRKIREFKCEECGCVSAALVEDDVHEIVCRQDNCMGEAKRIISAVVGNGGCAHGFLKRVAGFKNN